MSALSRFVLAAFAAVALLPACSGTVIDGSQGSQRAGRTPDGGAVQTVDGEVGRTPTSDGGAACVDGETRPAGDGCNSCGCSDGQWWCTLKGCITPPPPAVCTDGESRAGYSTDPPCSTCTCSGGKWNCVSTYCDGSECNPGQTRALDQCNSCTCTNGKWDCTELACDVDAGAACGGFLGNTCPSNEYCAYTEGALCGAADASAFCQPKPAACPDDYAPVCGCDGVTYPNSCYAGAAGTGIMTSGPCNSDN